MKNGDVGEAYIPFLQPRSDIGMEERIKKVLQAKAENNRITCETAWSIAKELQVDLTDIGKAADALGIKFCR